MNWLAFLREERVRNIVAKIAENGSASIGKEWDKSVLEEAGFLITWVPSALRRDYELGWHRDVECGMYWRVTDPDLTATPPSDIIEQPLKRFRK